MHVNNNIRWIQGASHPYKHGKLPHEDESYESLISILPQTKNVASCVGLILKVFYEQF